VTWVDQLSNQTLVKRLFQCQLLLIYFTKPWKLISKKLLRLGNKNSKKLVTKDLTYVPDPTALILHLCDLRDLNVMKAIVRISIYGGQGSLKIIMSLFDPDDLGAQR